MKPKTLTALGNLVFFIVAGLLFWAILFTTYFGGF